MTLLPVALLSGFQVSDTRGESREDGSAASAFEPGDISIGEPIALPFAGPRASGSPSEAIPTPDAPAQAAGGLRTIASPLAPIDSPAGLQPLAADPPRAQAATGQGWLGLVVAESSAPGRWIVDTVAPGGPAAAAGILPGDEVRGVNGIPLRNADEVSQALTAIAPGQQVGMAIARGEEVRDVQLAATARPVAVPVASAAPQGAAALPSAPVAETVAPAAVPLPAPRFTPSAAPDPTPAMASGDPPASRFGGSRGRPAAPQPSGSEPAFVAAPASAAPPAFATTPRESSTPSSGSSGRTALGVRTLPIDEGLQARFRLPAARGAYVIGVIQDLPASKAGVPPGSVIVSLDDHPVRTPDELTQLVTNGPVGRPVTLEYVLPGGTPQRADVVLQTLEQPLVTALVGPPEPQATAAPILDPGPTPTTARRPLMQLESKTATAMRAEIDWLRARLRMLEQELDAIRR
jgi:membrane-associated protease RseP (regulator of RpoE activity)